MWQYYTDVRNWNQDRHGQFTNNSRMEHSILNQYCWSTLNRFLAMVYIKPRSIILDIADHHEFFFKWCFGNQCSVLVRCKKEGSYYVQPTVQNQWDRTPPIITDGNNQFPKCRCLKKPKTLDDVQNNSSNYKTAGSSLKIQNRSLPSKNHMCWCWIYMSGER
jgi:hypothetical protein